MTDQDPQHDPQHPPDDRTEHPDKGSEQSAPPPSPENGKDQSGDRRQSDGDRRKQQDQPPETGGFKARLRRTPWRGWIWAVPLAAIILVGYLVIRTWLFSGPTITVTFPAADGISPQGTAVQYKGVQVGTVQDVALSDNDQAVVLTLSMKGDVAKLLRTGTRFWIVQPSLLSGDLSGMLSGAHIQMEPGLGKSADHFEGLIGPPPAMPTQVGEHFTLYARVAGNVAQETQLLYHGVTAGKVLHVSYDAARDQVRMDIFIRQPFVKKIGADTRFWRAGGFSLSSKDGGIQFNLPPVSDLIKGAIAFDTFPQQDVSGRMSKAYRLYESKDQALHVLSGPSAVFAARFSGSTQGLKPGSPVKLKGVKVGQVLSVGLRYDPQEHRMISPVTLALYVKPFGIATTLSDKASETSGNASKSGSPMDALRKVIADLVHQGLRAQLAGESLLLGGKEVSLVMAGKPGEAALNLASSPPRLPSISGGGIAGVLASINQITGKVNHIPIEAIGQNVRAIAAHVNLLSARLRWLADSPQIMQSIEHLDKALANVQDITGEVKGQIDPTFKRLNDLADAAQSLAESIRKTVAGSPGEQASIQNLVAELTRTARAVRTLANTLERHPESIIQGKSP